MKMKICIGGSSWKELGGLKEAGMTKMYFIYLVKVSSNEIFLKKTNIILLVFLGFGKVLRMDLKPKSSIAFVAWNYNYAYSS